jgi:hypothetical protein
MDSATANDGQSHASPPSLLWNGWIERTSENGLTLERWAFTDYNAFGLGRSSGRPPRIGLCAYECFKRKSKRSQWKIHLRWSVRKLPHGQQHDLKAHDVPLSEELLREALERYTLSYAPTIDPDAHLEAYRKELHFQRLFGTQPIDEPALTDT